MTAGQSTTAYFSIGANGAANNITNVRGDGIDCSLFGNGTEKCIIQFNVINANNTAGSSGINTGADQSVASGSAGAGTLYLDIHNNSITNTTGVGILATVSSVSSTGIYWIQNNTVTAPTVASGTVYGIRVSSGRPATLTNCRVRSCPTRSCASRSATLSWTLCACRMTSTSVGA